MGTRTGAATVAAERFPPGFPTMEVKQAMSDEGPAVTRPAPNALLSTICRIIAEKNPAVHGEPLIDEIMSYVDMDERRTAIARSFVESLVLYHSGLGDSLVHTAQKWREL